jgi:LysR family glycine cleavage system transcriptional activator
MRHLLPSLNALRAVEAIGRHGSVSAAAKELRVTPGAVSRQLALLEAHFKCSLFVRTQAGLVMSQRGRRYLGEIGTAFDLIDEASNDLVGIRGKTRLALQVWGTFGTEWLLPRLHRFESANPEIDVTMTAQLRSVNFDKDDADAGIVVGLRNLSNIEYEPLYIPSFLPVMSVKLIERLGRPSTPNDLKRFRLLHSMGSKFGWPEWLRSADATSVDVESGHRMENYSQVYRAARAGVGVALGQLLLIGDELLSGELVAPFQHTVPWSDQPYYLVWPKRRKIRPEIEAFRSWLLSELRPAEQRVRTLFPDLNSILKQPIALERDQLSRRGHKTLVHDHQKQA